MDSHLIHEIFLKAAIEAAKQGATARQLHDYLSQAAKGMAVNAAFCLSGDDLVAALEGEL